MSGHGRVDGSGARPRGTPDPLATAGALALWAALLVGARVWGVRVADRLPAVFLGAIPFFGRWELLLTWRVVVPVVAAVVAVVVLPEGCDRWRWRRVLAVSAAATVVWSLALGAVDGASTLTFSVQDDYGQHLHLVDDAGGPGAYARGFVDAQTDAPVHLQAHPPGLMVVLWWLDRAGVHGGWMHVALAMVAAATATVAVLCALANLAGRAAARVAAPFVAVAPAAIWHTNADVIFAGVALAAVALVVAATNAERRRADVLAAAGGVVFGVSLLLTYGVALVAVPMLAAAWHRRRARPVVIAGTAAAAVVVVPLVWGFWWLAGLSATGRQYALNSTTVRPYGYSLVGNAAVVAVAVGPAVVIGLCRLRDRAVWALVGAGIAMVVVAALSGLAKGEVERIWQPFFPLVLAGAAGLGWQRLSARRAWLAAQAVTAIAVQVWLRSPW